MSTDEDFFNDFNNKPAVPATTKTTASRAGRRPPPPPPGGRRNAPIGGTTSAAASTTSNSTMNSARTPTASSFGKASSSRTATAATAKSNGSTSAPSFAANNGTQKSAAAATRTMRPARAARPTGNYYGTTAATTAAAVSNTNTSNNTAAAAPSFYGAPAPAPAADSDWYTPDSTANTTSAPAPAAAAAAPSYAMFQQQPQQSQQQQQQQTPQQPFQPQPQQQPAQFQPQQPAAFGLSGDMDSSNNASVFVPQKQQQPTDNGAYAAPPDFSHEPPLLEELGINIPHIWLKTCVVALPSQRLNKAVATMDPQLVVEDADMAGPLALALLLGGEMLLSGKLQFGYIYGFGLFGCVAMTLILNLMSPKAVSVWTVTSVLGYALLPVNILALVKIFLVNIVHLTTLARLLAVLTILWSTAASTRLLEVGCHLRDQRYLIAYPIALLYSAFVLITIF